MLDKRCRYKIRHLQEFYLFVKHNRIYYAYYPKLKITRSTSCTDLQSAYNSAWNILSGLDNYQNQLLYKPFENDKKRQRDLKRALTYIDQSKPLTSVAIVKMQNEMLKEGLSGKSINNYVYILRRSYTGVFPNWKPVEHVATYRSCFPITSFYGFWQKCNSRLHYLAFFTMTTGCRLSEIKTCENLGNGYLKINGTKTKNAVRTIPVIPETIECLQYLQKGFRSAAYKESVIEAGKLCGFDEKYIEENCIVFHSFRKLYKTLLESCEIPETFINYYMGHSQTSKVQQLYFIGSSADDSQVYPRVIEALKRLV
jgi:integrase